MEMTDILDADLSESAAAEALKDIAIPPCPGIVAGLLAEAQREDIDFIRISRLITGDVALAAAVLKSAYGIVVSKHLTAKGSFFTKSGKYSGTCSIFLPAKFCPSNGVTPMHHDNDK